VADGSCRQTVARMRNGMPSWQLCRENFVSFSPDGETVLATGDTGDTLVLHDADDGDIEHELRAPGGLRAYGWESDDTVLYTTVSGASTVVVRCSVASGDCRTAVTLPSTGEIPRPLARFGD
jgi:hypothetical protein